MQAANDAIRRSAVLEEGRRQDCPLDDTQLHRLLSYLGLLQRWNRSHRLVGRSDPRTLVEVHLADSLRVAGWIRAHLPASIGDGSSLADRPSVLDVGSGAGLPGAVIAVTVPQARVSLCEIATKRQAFLHAVAREVDIPLQVIEADATSPDPALSGHTHVLSRAVFSPPRWREIGRRLVSPPGWLWSLLTAAQTAEHPAPRDEEVREHPYALRDGRSRVIRIERVL